MKKGFYLFLFSSLVAVLSLTLVSSAEAAAGTLAHPSSTPDTPYGGKVSAYDIRFLVASSTPTESQVRLIFPSGFSVPSSVATSSISASISAAGVVASATISGQEITLWIADSASVAADEEIRLFDIPGIVNIYAGRTFQLGIQTIGLAADVLEEASSTAFAIFGGESGTKKTTDTKPPVSSITLPTTDQVIPAGKNYVIMGTGKDNEGSVVTSVEVSVDGGSTWSAGLVSSSGGSYSWEYAWVNPTGGEYTVRVRATDSAGNRETPSAGVKVAVPGLVIPLPSPTPTPTPAVEKPISEMTTSELQAKITQLQQTVLVLLMQLVQILTAQL